MLIQEKWLNCIFIICFHWIKSNDTSRWYLPEKFGNTGTEIFNHFSSTGLLSISMSFFDIYHIGVNQWVQETNNFHIRCKVAIQIFPIITYFVSCLYGTITRSEYHNLDEISECRHSFSCVCLIGRTNWSEMRHLRHYFIF